jgi:hypothetical protein
MATATQAPMNQQEIDARFRTIAREYFHDPGIMEVRPDAKVTRTSTGAYVEVRMWLSNGDIDLD